jgi:hypothetical protein
MRRCLVVAVALSVDPMWLHGEGENPCGRGEGVREAAWQGQVGRSRDKDALLAAEAANTGDMTTYCGFVILL